MPTLDETLQAAADDAVDIDLSGAVEFSDLEAGKYLFYVREVEPDVSGPKSKVPGAPVLKWYTAVISDDESLNDTYGPIATTPTTGKGSGRTKAWLRALGYDLTNPNIKFSPASAKGRKFWGTVGPQKDDEQYLEFKKLEPFTTEPLG